MIARTVTWPIQPGKTEEFTKLFNTELRPLMQKSKGYSSDIAMVDGSRVIGVNVWQTRADADRYQAGQFQSAIDKLMPVLTAAPNIATHDLLVGA